MKPDRKRIVLEAPDPVKPELEALALKNKHEGKTLTTVTDLILFAIKQAFGIKPKRE